MSTSKDLIKLVDQGRAISLANQGQLKQFLNSTPPQVWLKKHPLTKGVVYLPIDKVELILDTVFQEWRVEVLEVKQLAQSIVCTVRLHYKNPISGEWSAQDGVGAVPLKTDKGFTAADLSHIKSDAVQTGAPAAKSFAIKDAAEHLGKLFGRDINRKDTASFTPIYEAEDTDEKVIVMLEKAQTMAELKQIYCSLSANQQTKKVVAKKDELKKKLSKEE